MKVNKGHGDKSNFNHQNKPPGIRFFLPTSGGLRQYKDTEKPYPRKAALPEKLSTLRKKSRFSPSKLGIIPDRIPACDFKDSRLWMELVEQKEKQIKKRIRLC